MDRWVVSALGGGEDSFAPVQPTHDGYPSTKADVVDNWDGHVDEGGENLPINSLFLHHCVAVGSGVLGGVRG